MTHHFSSRFAWDLPPNRISKLIEEKRRAGAAILDLTESNPTRAGFSYPTEEILQSLANPRALVYEPSPAGLLEARQAVSDYYAARGHTVGPDRILLTASTSEAYSYVFKLLASPGDEVLVPQPSYPLFGYLADADSVTVAPYSLVYYGGGHGGWMLDSESAARASTSRTRAIVVVNPNNPTGSFLKHDELEALLALCTERDLAIVSDEVFADYALAPDPRRVSSLVDVDSVLTFSLSGLSKIAGLPQMKLGWIVLGGPVPLRRRAMERLELIADTYLSVGTPVQHALGRLLALGAAVRNQIASRVRENYLFLRTETRGECPCKPLEVEGGWYAILQAPRTKSEEDWCLELLDRDSVLVQPGFFYDFESEAFLVLSLLTEPEKFREGVRRLLARINNSSM